MKYSSQPDLDKNVLELVWNNTNEAIFTIGYDGQILSANPSFTAILGWEITDSTEVNCFPNILKPLSVFAVLFLLSP